LKQLKQKILFDTSVWIEYFKKINTKQGTVPTLLNLVDSCLLRDRVYINGIIIAELIQGLKTHNEEKEFSRALGGLHELEITTSEWRLAGKISADLRRKGITLPLTDIAIAANAIKNDLLLYSFGKHFLSIDKLNFKLLPANG